MTRGKVARVGKLEAKRRAFDAAHVPLSDLPGFLFAVLGVVFDEAGPDVGGRVARRVVEAKAARLSALARAHGWPT